MLGYSISRKISARFLEEIAWRVRHSSKGHRADIWRRPGAKHCSSLCSQSEGGEYCDDQARAENPTKLCPRALSMFATCSWPSLCEQSELQCWRRNRRLCGANANLRCETRYCQYLICFLEYPILQGRGSLIGPKR